MRSIRIWHMGTLVILFAIGHAYAQTPSEIRMFQSLTGLPASLIVRVQKHPFQPEQQLFHLKNGLVCWIDAQNQRFALARSGALTFPKRARLLDANPPSLQRLSQAAALWEKSRHPETKGAMSWEVILTPQGWAYLFRFEEQLITNSALTGNIHEWMMTPCGELIGENIRWEPWSPKAALPPLIDLSQAIRKSLKSLPGKFDYLDHREARLRWEGDRLFWSFQVHVVDETGSASRYHAQVDGSTGQARMRVSPLNLCAQPPRNRMMIGRQLMNVAWGPSRSGSKWRVSLEAAELLGGKLIRGSDSAALIGDQTIKLNQSDLQARGGKIFLCAFALQRAFPKTIALMLFDTRLGSLNLLCDRESVDLWSRENRLVFANSIEHARANTILRNARASNGSLNLQSIQESPLSEGDSAGLLARGWWLGLLSALSGMAFLTRRKRRGRWSMRHA